MIIKLEKWFMRVMKSRRVEESCPKCKKEDYVADNSIKSLNYYLLTICILSLGLTGLYVGGVYGLIVLVSSIMALPVFMYLSIYYYRLGKQRGVLVCWDCEHIWKKS